MLTPSKIDIKATPFSFVAVTANRFQGHYEHRVTLGARTRVRACVCVCVCLCIRVCEGSRWSPCVS